MREAVLVPTYLRPELLFCCLKRIRAIEPDIEIHIFPDRGTFHDPIIRETASCFGAHAHFVPDHDWHGNTANTMDAYLWAYNAGYDRTFYVEDDVMVHPDFFAWHRAQHEMFPKIFASMAWIFNRHAPIADDVLFQPWYYSIGTCFARRKLELIVQHSSSRYYSDMQKYIDNTFKGNMLNSLVCVTHYEQDGLIQRVLDADKSQTVSPGIAKCDHIGWAGYNRGWDTYQKLFERALDFDERVKRVEAFIADPYCRIEAFGREIVEREVGRELPKRNFMYRADLPGGWSTTFESELTIDKLPHRVHSVVLPPEAKVMVIS